MQFERNALNHTTNIINSQPPTTTIPSFHSSANIDALKYNLFHHNLNSDNYVKSPSTTSSSDEGNSPTELNNCRKLLEKPPLVKRLTMGILRTQEDSRPLVHNKSSSITSSDSIQTISDGYVNEAICDSDKIVSNKFSDSFRQAFNHHTFQMQPLSSSISNAIPLNTLNLKKNVITTSVQVHNASDKSTNLSYNYNETNFCDFDYKKSFNNNETAPPSPTGSDKRTIVPPILPLRNDALSIPEQNDLKNCSWFQAGLPREISLEILTRQNPGAFLVRQSESKMGCFALSLRVPPPAPAKVAHYLILRTQRGGYKIKGFTKEFSSLRALITHHSVMKELLPIPLNLPRQYEIQQHQRHDLDDLDNLWYIK